MDNSSRHLSLTDRKFKPCFDYPCENNFQIADRLEKTKHKLEITYFSQNDLVLKILKFFPSHFHRRHLLMFSLPIEKLFHCHKISIPLSEKCPYSELLSPNAGKYGPEWLRIRTLFAQWSARTFIPYSAPRLIIFALTHALMLWFRWERSILNIN